jgi:uncharacterized protein (TIGR03083 family)
MDTATHVEHMGIETGRLVDRLSRCGLDAVVPTCPGWVLRDLAVHTAMAHRWAAAVIERRAQHRDDVTPADALGVVPADAQFAEWLTAGQAQLADVIAATPPDADYGRIMRNATSSVAFWARRQAHETAVHRADADLADGVEPTAVPPEFAVDGVGELVLGFAPRYRPGPITPATIRFTATDVDHSWTVSLGEGTIRSATGSDGEADLRVEATASDLYFILWNRSSTDRATLVGDATAFDTWRATVAV